MPIPLQITAREISLSKVAEAGIRARAIHLQTYYEQITSCRVVIKGPRRHHRKGLYRVRIDLNMPGAELVADRHSDADLYVAIRDSFDAARRREVPCTASAESSESAVSLKGLRLLRDHCRGRLTRFLLERVSRPRQSEVSKLTRMLTGLYRGRSHGSMTDMCTPLVGYAR